jgi:hypothetical protein
VSGKIKRLEITNTIPTWKHIRFLGYRLNDLARQAPSEMNFPFGPTSSANYHNRQRFAVGEGLHSNRVSSNRRLCFRETEFCAQRQRRRNIRRSSQGLAGRDEANATTRPIARELPDSGEISSKVGMRGGGRSRGRTRLLAPKSLVTGKYQRILVRGLLLADFSSRFNQYIQSSSSRIP